MNAVDTGFALDNTLEHLPPRPRLAGRWLRLARLAWFLVALLALAVFVLALPGYAQKISTGLPSHGPAVEPSQGYTVLQVVNTLASLASVALSFALSALLFRRRFANPAVAAVSFYLLLYAVIMTGPVESVAYYWLGSGEPAINLQALLMSAPTIALLVLFPNGAFVPRWTRWILVASIPWSLLTLVLPIFPFRAEHRVGLLALALSWAAMILLGIYAQVYRYRRVSSIEERQQTRWVLFGFLLWFGYVLVSTFPFFYLSSLPPGTPEPWWGPLSEFGWWLSLNIVPVSLAVAITRARLWDIDVLINRTLVYGTLTFSTMALYILLVGGLGSLFQVGDNSFVAFLATGAVAVLFIPLRDRLQSWVNRLMYGERDDPVSVLRKLGAELEHTGSPEAALAGITHTVAAALKLPYVAIELGESREVVAQHGASPPAVLRLPMSYQSETSGYLVVAPRSPGESFSDLDRRLLENIAQQAGAAAHAARLTADLRLSRQRLVAAREEERRRLRRDLHDGLGPTLASLTLKMDMTRNLLRSDPEKAEQVLVELKGLTKDTIQDIRDLVYELRPPALDELGLIGAIQNFIDNQAAGVPAISLEVPAPLPPLPAAFEVAVYRIALEGLTNILRHANAQTAALKIWVGGDQLIVEILDDGAGLPQGFTSGVGMASMRERAEELGGTFEYLPGVPGSHLRARLPLMKE